MPCVPAKKPAAQAALDRAKVAETGDAPTFHVKAEPFAPEAPQPLLCEIAPGAAYPVESLGPLADVVEGGAGHDSSSGGNITVESVAKSRGLRSNPCGFGLGIAGGAGLCRCGNAWGQSTSSQVMILTVNQALGNIHAQSVAKCSATTTLDGFEAAGLA